MTRCSKEFTEGDAARLSAPGSVEISCECQAAGYLYRERASGGYCAVQMRVGRPLTSVMPVPSRDANGECNVRREMAWGKKCETAESLQQRCGAFGDAHAAEYRACRVSLFGGRERNSLAETEMRRRVDSQ